MVPQYRAEPPVTQLPPYTVNIGILPNADTYPPNNSNSNNNSSTAAHPGNKNNTTLALFQRKTILAGQGLRAKDLR